jgi:hypothetical protein
MNWDNIVITIHKPTSRVLTPVCQLKAALRRCMQQPGRCPACVSSCVPCDKQYPIMPVSRLVHKLFYDPTLQ